MDDLQVCRICLIMDVQMYNLRSSPLDAYFEHLLGVNPHSHKLLTQVCTECAVLINKYYIFREKCVKGIGIFQDIYGNNGKITKEDIKCIDRDQYKLTSTIKLRNEKNSFLYICSHLEELQPKSTVDIQENLLDIGHSWIDDSKILPDIPDEFNDDHSCYSDPDEKPSQIFDMEAEETDTHEASGTHKKNEENDLKGNNEDPSKSTIDIQENLLDIGHSLIDDSKIIADIPDEFNDDHSCYSDPDEKPSQIFNMEAEETDTHVASGTHKQKQIEDNDLKGDHKDPEEISLADDNTNSVEHSDYDDDDNNSLYNVHPNELNAKQETIKERILKMIADNDKTVNNCFDDNLFLEPRAYVNVDLKEINLSTTREPKTDTPLLTEVARPRKKKKPKSRKELKAKDLNLKNNRKSVVDVESSNEWDIFEIVTYTLEEQQAAFKAREQSELYQNATNKCTICFKVAQGAQALEEHMTKHNPSYQFVCAVCGYRYPSRTALYNHERTHRQRFVCTLCSAALITRRQLKAHQEKHKEEEVFQCKQCMEVFQNRSSYSTHLRSEHPSPHQCRLCGYSFASEAGLTKHRARIHKDTAAAEGQNDTMDGTDEGEPTQDGLVDTNGPRKSDDKSCTPSDRPDSPLPCPHCPKAFRTPRKLALHMTVHSNEKRYSCDVCGTKFKFKTSMITHQRKHSGKREMCRLCGKSYATIASRNAHLKYVHYKEPQPPRKNKPQKESAINSNTQIL